MGGRGGCGWRCGWCGVLEVVIHGEDEVVSHGCCTLEVNAAFGEVCQGVSRLDSFPHFTVAPTEPHLSQNLMIEK